MVVVAPVAIPVGKLLVDAAAISLGVWGLTSPRPEPRPRSAPPAAETVSPMITGTFSSSIESAASSLANFGQTASSSASRYPTQSSSTSVGQAYEDPAWLARQAELQQMAQLQSMHQQTQSTLDQSLAIAQKPEMAITMNGRRVDTALPVYALRGSDAMATGETAMAAIQRTMQEQRAHARAANAQSQQWFKVVTLRQIPGLATPVPTAITGTRSELQALVSGGYLQPEDLEQAGVNAIDVLPPEEVFGGDPGRFEQPVEAPQGIETEVFGPTEVPSDTDPTGLRRDLPLSTERPVDHTGHSPADTAGIEAPQFMESSEGLLRAVSPEILNQIENASNISEAVIASKLANNLPISGREGLDIHDFTHYIAIKSGLNGGNNLSDEVTMQHLQTLASEPRNYTSLQFQERAKSLYESIIPDYQSQMRSTLDNIESWLIASAMNNNKITATQNANNALLGTQADSLLGSGALGPANLSSISGKSLLI